jgi:hypothetical protein
VNPTAKLAGMLGATAIEDKMDTGVVVDVVMVLEVDVDEQDTITTINPMIIPIVRQLIKNRICFLFKVISPFLNIPICLKSPAILYLSMSSKFIIYIVPHFPEVLVL